MIDIYLVHFSTFLDIWDRRNQPANYGMVQKELITGSSNSATQDAKLLLKMPISNLSEIWSNTDLFEFGLAKSDIRQLP